MYCRTTISSKTMHKTDKTEIGLKSAGDKGYVILAIGWIIALFHSSGTCELAKRHTEQVCNWGGKNWCSDSNKLRRDAVQTWSCREHTIKQAKNLELWNLWDPS